MIELDRGPRDCFLELWPSVVVKGGGVLDGWITFRDPLGSDRNESLAVTTGPGRDDATGTAAVVIKRWHLERHADGTVTTDPSILLEGRWHMAPGARWTPTPANPDGTWPADPQPQKA